MSSSDLAHPFCDPNLLPMVQGTKTSEIAPDVWMIQGNLGPDFFLAPPSSNIFILRDGELVILLDTGMHPHYRGKMLKILRQCAEDGAKTLVLCVSQAHWDHALNNDVIFEAGFENVRFILPEPELPLLESTTHWLEDLRKMEHFYSPYDDWIEKLVEVAEKAKVLECYKDPQYQPVWQEMEAMIKNPTRNRIRAALKLYAERVLFAKKRTLSERAEVLSPDSRKLLRFGDVTFHGWQIGRFILIHDGAHSPGHITLYDPKYKLVLCGDVTIEINPPFFDASMNKLIEVAGSLRRMADQGFIEVVSDGHRCEMFSLVFEMGGLKPLHPTQNQVVIEGKDDCIAFFKTFEELYLVQVEEILAAHQRIGEATVGEIVEELFKSDDPRITFKKGIPFPSRPELMVSIVLRENGYQRRESGDRILFTPLKNQGVIQV